MSIVGSERLHSSHISFFRRIVLHAAQKCFISSFLVMSPLARDMHISLTIVCTSSMFSTCRTTPLTCLAYLLTAV